MTIYFKNLKTLLSNSMKKKEEKQLILKKNFDNLRNFLNKKNINIDYGLIYKKGKLYQINNYFMYDDKKMTKINKNILLRLIINMLSPIKTLTNLTLKEKEKQKEILLNNINYTKKLFDYFNNGKKVKIKNILGSIEFEDKKRNKNIFYITKVTNPTFEILKEISKSYLVKQIELKILNSNILKDKDINTVIDDYSNEEYNNKHYFIDTENEFKKVEKKEYIDLLNVLYQNYENNLNSEIIVDIILELNDNVSLVEITYLLEFLELNGLIFNNSLTINENNELSLNLFELFFLTNNLEDEEKEINEN